jgi:hypothetical protein
MSKLRKVLVIAAAVGLIASLGASSALAFANAQAMASVPVASMRINTNIEA